MTTSGDIPKTNVHFFDLGAYDGADSVRFMENMTGLAVKPFVYMVEANPVLANKLPVCIGGVPVETWNFAVSKKCGPHPFYLAEIDEGSSIYATKTNLSGESLTVEHAPFTKWLRDAGLVPKKDGDIWILKANLEGAEYDLICDLEEAEAWSWFDIFCGPAFVVEDMQKCSELVDLRQDAMDLIRARAPATYPFAVPTKNYPLPDYSVDLGALVKRIIDNAV